MKLILHFSLVSWENNINMILQEVWWGCGLDSTGSGGDKWTVVSTMMNLRVP